MDNNKMDWYNQRMRAQVLNAQKIADLKEKHVQYTTEEDEKNELELLKEEFHVLSEKVDKIVDALEKFVKENEGGSGEDSTGTDGDKTDTPKDA